MTQKYVLVNFVVSQTKKDLKSLSLHYFVKIVVMLTLIGIDQHVTKKFKKNN